MLENENKELVEKLKVFRRVTKGGIGRMMSSKQSGGYKSSNKSKKQIENDYLDENI